jgi:hypothetical protein
MLWRWSRHTAGPREPRPPPGDRHEHETEDVANDQDGRFNPANRAELRRLPAVVGLRGALLGVMLPYRCAARPAVLRGKGASIPGTNMRPRGHEPTRANRPDPDRASNIAYPLGIYAVPLGRCLIACSRPNFDGRP